MFTPKLTVGTITIRKGAAEWALRELSKQNFKDFEYICVDAFYDECKEEVAELAKELGIHFIHLPEYQTHITVVPNRGSNWNEVLKYMTTDYLVCLDDYHVCPPDWLSKHMMYFDQGCQSMSFRWMYTPLKEHMPWEEFLPLAHKKALESPTMSMDGKYDHRYLKLQQYTGKKQLEDQVFEMPFGWWWPNTCSITKEAILTKVGGYDVDLDGGTAGEDVALSMRMYRTGTRFFYDPSLITFHIVTENNDIETKQREDVCHDLKCARERSLFSDCAENTGDPTLMESDSLIAKRSFDGYRYLNCKTCNWHGNVDSLEMHRRQRELANIFPIHASPWGLGRHTLRERHEIFENGYNHKTKCALCK